MADGPWRTTFGGRPLADGLGGGVRHGRPRGPSAMAVRLAETLEPHNY
jgi:hypothetical protein